MQSEGSAFSLLGPFHQMFSDTLILACPIWTRPYKCGEPELGDALSYTSWYQFWLALEGFFTRGAMTYGELHVSDELCFGKALVEAHCLERDRAVSPRVILSPSVKRLVKHHLTFYGCPTNTPQDHNLVVDPDGELFVNYLEAVNYGEYGSDLDMLAKHRARIVENLDMFVQDNDVRAKYVWLRDYHNFFCEHHLYGSEECPLSEWRVAELRIEASGEPVRPFRRLSADDAERLVD